MADRPPRDLSLNFHWRALDNDWIKALDLPPPHNRKSDEARASVLLAALIASRHAPGLWISYSRRKEWWRSGKRYRGTAYTYATVVNAVDDLSHRGLLEHDRQRPGSLGRQSRFRASPLLQGATEIPPVTYDPVELIRLKDRDQKLVDYRDTPATKCMRRRVAEFNEALSTAELQLNSPIVRPDGMLLCVGDNHVLYPAMTTLHRVFNRCSFGCGGRFYGPWWQQIPKDVRPDLLIDGEPTIERDYPQLHPNMLYAEIGERLQGDAYAIDGWPRDLVKRGFNTLVNAANYNAALRAIALETSGPGAYGRARALIASIKEKHPLIIKKFHSDSGIRLQRRDASMAEAILCRLIRRGVVVLPIHDSFITAERHASVLDEAMDDAREQYIGYKSQNNIHINFL